VEFILRMSLPFPFPPSRKERRHLFLHQPPKDLPKVPMPHTDFLSEHSVPMILSISLWVSVFFWDLLEFLCAYREAKHAFRKYVRRCENVNSVSVSG